MYAPVVGAGASSLQFAESPAVPGGAPAFQHHLVTCTAVPYPEVLFLPPKALCPPSRRGVTPSFRMSHAIRPRKDRPP